MCLVFDGKGDRFGDVNDLMAFGFRVARLSVGRQGSAAVFAAVGHIGVRGADALGRQQGFGMRRMSWLPAGFAAGRRLGWRLGLWIVWPRLLLFGQIIEAILHTRRLCLQFLNVGGLLLELHLQLGMSLAQFGDELVAKLTSGAAGRVRQVINQGGKLQHVHDHTRRILAAHG